MPELPEVETVRRQIEPLIADREVVDVQVGWERTLGGLSPRAFGRAVIGARFAAARRHGKQMYLDLVDDDRVHRGHLFVHLRMTGRLEVGDATGATPWDRVVFTLDDGRLLRFIDPRKFGRVLFVREATDILSALGPEPISADYDVDRFAADLRGRRRRIKSLLLDQAFLAGLGNIYVDEALFLARIHPLTPADRIRGQRARRLHTAMREVLEAAIASDGSSFDAFYRTPEGKAGCYQDAHQVYGRSGSPCPRCETTIRRILIDQRSSCFCPRCQPRPRRG